MKKIYSITPVLSSYTSFDQTATFFQLLPRDSNSSIYFDHVHTLFMHSGCFTFNQRFYLMFLRLKLTFSIVFPLKISLFTIIFVVVFVDKKVIRISSPYAVVVASSQL